MKTFIRITKKPPVNFDLVFSFPDKKINRMESFLSGFRKNFSMDEFPAHQDGKSGEFQGLVRCYQKSLKISEKNKIKSVCFSPIPVEYDYPKRKTAKIIMKTIHDYIEKNSSSIGVIVFLVSDDEEFDIFVSEHAKIRRNKT